MTPELSALVAVVTAICIEVLRQMRDTRLRRSGRRRTRDEDV